MKRTFTKFDYLGMFLEAFFCGMISILQPQLANIMLSQDFTPAYFWFIYNTGMHLKDMPIGIT